jgi:hypothetical protein
MGRQVCHFLDSVFEHNKYNEDKKYLFLICHSFQLASIHWKLGTSAKENLILSE